ncbi:hypothetical protein CAEBREN_07746 [Caenorhabditis brenneri]|uniref:Uncharacterized protein n=1 Tax=Caenorhabditis brenneri TaxID=135651 RepID=G0MMP0_CAEBE|nr:hypothetical protein CAEBREN_07746 [Caenorhabditis brenneri]
MVSGDLPPRNTANPARDHLEAFVDDTPASSPPNSSGTSSSGMSFSTSSSIPLAANNAVLPKVSSSGIFRQSTAHIGPLLDEPPQNRAILDEDAELDLEVELILSNVSKKDCPIQASSRTSHWPQPFTSALPTSTVNQQQHSDYRPEFAQYPSRSSCQPFSHPQSHPSLAPPPFSGAQQQQSAYCLNTSQYPSQPSYAPSCQPQPHTSTAQLPFFADQHEHPVHRPNLSQCSTDHSSCQPQPATHPALPQSSGGQYQTHSTDFWEWAKVKTFEEAMEDIEKNQRNKVEERELTKEEKLWNKAVLHTLENKEIYFNRHLAGKPLNLDRYLFPSSLFNPFGENAKMPQVVTKPPRLINVFKRAQKLVGADKFPSNKDTRQQCEKWAKMMKTEHNLQIGLGFIVPRQMRAMKKRQADGAVQMDYGLEDMDSDDEPPRKIVRMAGNYGDDNNDNNSGDESEDIN